MRTAIITACASVVVAVLVFILNQQAQLRQERRKAQLVRINEQLRELYGPLNALVNVNEQIWESLRAAGLPQKEQRAANPPWNDWKIWHEYALLPANMKMRDLIISHADLLVESEVPLPIQAFCAHVTSQEVLFKSANEGVNIGSLIPHPGEPYIDYVQESFTRLKMEQYRILNLLNPT